jgi:biotin carboxyl carrier protein
MKIEVRLGNLKKSVEILWADGKPQFTVDGRLLEAEALEIANGIYSVLIAQQSFEVRVEKRGSILSANIGGEEYTAEVRDPRRLKRRRGEGAGTEGRKEVIAPMPGKVVRVLAGEGDAVEAHKGLVVIEAMKMQNEVRSPKSGIVERMLVAEGQAVVSGEVLAIIA